MKLLVVAPHLSTGGMPQYLLKYLETYKDKYSEIKVIEFSSFSFNFVIQKDKIKNLIGDENLITLGHYPDWEKDNDLYIKRRSKLLNIIDEFQPDVVYMSGTPECYEYKLPPDEIMQQVYRTDRKYKIIETCHNNSFDFNNKRYIPDEFMFCSKSHMDGSTNIDIPKTVWEYPMEIQERPDRAEVLTDLGLDPSYLHILNVGLIHPNKNQKYIFDLAKKFKNQKIQFHFIGNSCFLESSGITPEDTQMDSCKIWGERDDVDKFMSCMDIYLFPSKKELNPLTIKEALSWGMKVVANEDKNYTHQYKEYSNFYLIEDIDVEGFINKECEDMVLKTEGKFLMVCSMYNQTKDHILQTFKNVINQTHDNWLLIVGDDFSDNGCGEMLKEEVKKINHKNIIHYDVKFKRELHLSQNFFKGIKYDYFLMLDADDFLSENLLEVYDYHFRKYPNVFSVYCDYEAVSEDGVIERMSVIKKSDMDVDDEFHSRNGSSYYGLWEKYHSWNMFGHARCFRKSSRDKFLIKKNCPSSTDACELFNCLHEGDHLPLPRNLYKLTTRTNSCSSTALSPEVMRDFNTNTFFAIEEYSKNKKYEVFDIYDDVWFETSALSYSNVVKNNHKINLISNINDDQLLKIKSLYYDKDIVFNKPFEDNMVIVWNKFNKTQKIEILQLLKDKAYNFSIYCFLDDFSVSEDGMEEYFKKSSSEFFDLINKYIKGYSFFSYFRHIVINIG
jgi:hypothetical protein